MSTLDDCKLAIWEGKKCRRPDMGVDNFLVFNPMSRSELFICNPNMKAVVLIREDDITATDWVIE